MDQTKIKPFIKWAGGKTQILNQIINYYPKELNDGKILNYYEPFLGGGACFLNLANQHEFERIYLSDVNYELMLAYEVLKKNVEILIEFLMQFKKIYMNLSEKQKETYYYEMRIAFNLQRFSINYERYNENWIPRAAQFIFLNKTCFNGLYRINLNGDFNVPFGKRYNPEIFDINNLLSISKLLQRTELIATDFDALSTKPFKNSFVFLDPPYRPLFKNSNFTSYTQCNFKENDQLRLVNFFKKIDHLGAKIMMTNSNPKNKNKNDDFFQKHFSSYNIHKINSTRMINNISGSRYCLTDLLITNY